MQFRNATNIVVAMVALFTITGDASAGGKTKKGKTPATSSRSEKAPSAYHVFLETAKDSAKAGAGIVNVANKSLTIAFTRSGYVLDTQAEAAPKGSSDELAKWLRDKDRTGLKLDITIESIKESQDKGATRFDAKVKATVFTAPSGWLVMSTTAEAGALSDGLMLDKDLQEAAVEAAMNALVENIAKHLAKKPVPIDR
jgi:hypothetical protein